MQRWRSNDHRAYRDLVALALFRRAGLCKHQQQLTTRRRAQFEGRRGQSLTMLVSQLALINAGFDECVLEYVSQSTQSTVTSLSRHIFDTAH